MDPLDQSAQLHQAVELHYDKENEEQTAAAARFYFQQLQWS
jgi:hypothetical protein